MPQDSLSPYHWVSGYLWPDNVYKSEIISNVNKSLIRFCIRSRLKYLLQLYVTLHSLIFLNHFKAKEYHLTKYNILFFFTVHSCIVSEGVKSAVPFFVYLFQCIWLQKLLIFNSVYFLKYYLSIPV